MFTSLYAQHSHIKPRSSASGGELAINKTTVARSLTWGVRWTFSRPSSWAKWIYLFSRYCPIVHGMYALFLHIDPSS